MPINPEFPKNYKVIGKHKNADGQNYHYVWGPGRLSDAAENEEATGSICNKRRRTRSHRSNMEPWLLLIGMLVMQMVLV